MNANMNTVLNTVPSPATHDQDSDLLSLPLELLDSIVTHLDLKSLARLACTCRLFSSYPLVVQHPDYALLKALTHKDLTRFRTLIMDNKYSELSQGLLSTGASFSRRWLVLNACIWILVAHLNEPSPHFWVPLSHLLCVQTRFRDYEFITRLASVAVDRQYALGLQAFSEWLWKNGGRRLGFSGIAEILLALSNSKTGTTLPLHIKSDLQLALFRLAQTTCASHSHREKAVPTCALHLLAATEDLGVIIRGLLFLQQQQEISETLFWFKHAVSDQDEPVPAIQCLLAELLHRGRYDLFKDLLDIWMLVLARGSKESSSRNFVPQVHDGDSDDDSALAEWIVSCGLDRIEVPKIQLGGTSVYDYRRDVVARLALYGVSDEQANRAFQLFKRYASPLELEWIVDVDYFWSVPHVLDGWVQWLLTHVLVDVANVVIFSRAFPEMVQYLSHDTIALILERVPIRSLAFHLMMHEAESPPVPQFIKTHVLPYSFSPAVALAHAGKLQSALDSDQPSLPVRVLIPEPAYWTSTLAILSRHYPAQLAPICKHALAGMRNPGAVHVNTIPFAKIVDALVQGGQLTDALAALREAVELGSAAGAGDKLWLLARDQCAFLHAGGVGRVEGIKELVAFVWEHGWLRSQRRQCSCRCWTSLGCIDSLS